jgi:eukaryotic-like serine/threonine-protein kinase
MALSAGSRLGPYEIVSPLGEGGMGEVYRARDTRLDRTVAVKILNAQVVNAAGVRQRFEREAKVISQLQHPHICTLHDVGSESGTDFLVMEYLEGETLSSRVRKGPLGADQVLKIAIEIAAALETAHRAGVIHRDLKPANVMLTKGGAKLLDFGLAKPLTAAAGAAEPSSASVFSAALTMSSPASPLSTAGTIVGTVQYMSPEQISGQEADARSDIFAFGVLLFEMITGKRAFDGKTQASVVGAILAVEPPPVSALQPSTPRALDRVVRICLSKDPEERFQSVHDLKLQLEAIAEAGEAVAGIPPRAAGRERMAWIAAAAAIVVMLLLAGWLLFRPAPPARVLRSTLLPPKDVRIAPTEIALSPDGTRVAFIGETGGSRSIYMRLLSSTDSHPVSQTDGASYPFWSPDGQWLGFFADAKLKKVDLSTGGSLVLADAAGGRGGSWGADNTIIFAAGPTGALTSVPASGGAVSPATTPIEGNTSERWPQYLPGGRYLLYWVAYQRTTGSVSADPTDKKTGEYLLDLKTKQSRLLLQTDSGAIYASGYLLYIWQNNLMTQRFDPDSGKLSGTPTLVTQRVAYDSDRWIGGFSASADGLLALVSGEQLLPSQLTWVDRTGKTVGQLTPPGIYYWPALSPDDKHIAFATNVGRQTSIWTLDVERGTKTRFTFDDTLDGYPTWSPDGKQIAYATSGPFDLLLKNSSGIGAAEKVANNSTVLFPQGWGSAGILYFGAENPTTAALYLYSPADKKAKKLPVTGTIESGKISPDGKWLAYGSRESGASEVYVSPYPELNAKWQVSTSGGTMPLWSRTGGELFYISRDGKLMTAAITTTSGFRADVPKPLFPYHGSTLTGYQYDVARDGRFVVNTLIDQGTAEPITLVTNWTAELKK